MRKKILTVIIVILIAVQLVRPEKNQSGEQKNDITTLYTLPDDVHALLKAACYDCHSNYTHYPWYSKIQPVAWWLQNHINDGKRHLNFSEFATYSLKKQAHKMEEVAEQVEKGEMPLNSYTWIHKEARLSATQRSILIRWANALQQQIKQTNTNI